MTVIVWDTKKLVCDRQSSKNGVIQAPVKKHRFFEIEGQPAVAMFAGFEPAVETTFQWLKEGANSEKIPTFPTDQDWGLSVVVWIPQAPNPLVLYYEGHPVIEDASYWHCYGAGHEVANAGKLVPNADGIYAAWLACETLTSCGGGLTVIEFQGNQFTETLVHPDASYLDSA